MTSNPPSWTSGRRSTSPTQRLVIVVRADPVICGHSGEARNLAEVAIERGFDDVRIVTWPIEVVQAAGLPLKPLDTVMPYSPGITVERPGAVGDYKVPDGRFTSAMKGRLFELFTDGVPTVCLSLYLLPHATVVQEALVAARASGLPCNVVTLAEAVGSDITNIARNCVTDGQLGAAAYLFSTYLAHDHCLAVSDFTKQQIVESAEVVDDELGSTFAPQCRRRVRISYPAIDTAAYIGIEPALIAPVLRGRGLEQDQYVLFLSRITPAKGVDDLIDAYRRSAVRHRMPLVIAGTGPNLGAMRARAEASFDEGGVVVFFDDVDDAEKSVLMAGCAAYALPSKPAVEFVETFGIALVEKMLAGGGPIITTRTGGIPEAVGDTAIDIPAGDPAALADALDLATLGLSAAERRSRADLARAHAVQFDRGVVFDRMMEPVMLPLERDLALA